MSSTIAKFVVRHVVGEPPQEVDVPDAVPLDDVLQDEGVVDGCRGSRYRGLSTSFVCASSYFAKTSAVCFCEIDNRETD